MHLPKFAEHLMNYVANLQPQLIGIGITNVSGMLCGNLVNHGQDGFTKLHIRIQHDHHDRGHDTV
jgi:hypothetical protein